ncbi:MAG TPA: cation:proton antiporter [Actinomycetota bacterium]|nr:cation:proton antiporter [Actinomycetota bacterium]
MILEVFLIFAGAKAAGELFVRLRLPALAGELLVGVLLGPAVLGWVHVNNASIALADLGIVVLLFAAGLESPIGELIAVGRAALMTSVGGVVATVVAAFGALVALGIPGGTAAPAALALAATSVGIAARAFGDLGAIGSPPARVVLGAAVVDDVLVLAALPLVLRVGTSGSSAAEVITGVVGAVAFVAAVAFVGPWLARRHLSRWLEAPRTRRSPFVLSLVLCLGLAALAERVGLAALIGAFLAGMILAETEHRASLERQMEPLFDFLVPFFFVVSGARLDPGALGDAGPGFLAAVVGAALVAKPLGAAAGAIGLHGRQRLAVGAGMMPRGEVTLAVATGIAAAGGTSASELYAALLAAVFLSTVLAAPLLQAVLPPGDRHPAEPRTDIPPEAFDVDEEP